MPYIETEVDGKRASIKVGDGVEIMLPLKKYAEMWTVGWDIPGYWAVDAADNVYADLSYHGFGLEPVDPRKLIEHIENGETRGDASYLRELAGRKPKMPRWMRTALDNQWAPPSSWRRDDYE